MSLLRYAEYKDSGVGWLGEVPAHWQINRLKFGLRLLTDKTTRRTNPVALENIESWSGRFLATETEFQGEGTAFEEGDVLFGKLRPYLAKVLLAKSSGEAVGDFHVLRPATGVVPRYAQYQLLSREFIGVVDGSTFGSKMPRASWEFLANLPFVLPDAEEQSAIATFLDRETGKIDALIAEQEKLLTLLAEKRQATISHAVTRGLTNLPGADLNAAFGGGPKGEGKDSPSSPNAPMKDSGVPWLGEVPAHWKVLALRRLIDRFEQGWSPECEARPADPGEWGVLKAGCVNGGEFDAQENKALPISLVPREELELKSGDVLMSRASGSPKLIGSVACVINPPSHLMLSDKIFRIRLTADVDPRFFAAAMGSTPLRQQIEQAIGGAEGLANNLPQARIKEFWMSLPPVDEQLAIVEFLACERAKLDDLAGAAEHAVALLKERRSALIAAAVTGKIDVRH